LSHTKCAKTDGLVGTCVMCKDNYKYKSDCAATQATQGLYVTAYGSTGRYCKDFSCHNQKRIGEPCSHDDHNGECLSDRCSSGLKCICNRGKHGDRDCPNNYKCLDSGKCVECTSSPHCGSGQYCHNNACYTTKAVTATCSESYMCKSNRCRSGKCVCDGGNNGNSDCATQPGKYCTDSPTLGQCVQCTGDSHCSRLTSTRFCGANSCRQCTQTSHCASNQYCTNYKCVARKAYQASCSSGDQCLTTRCLSGKCACEPKVSGRGCPAGKSKCGGSAERYCYQCTSDSHCSGSTRYCNNNVCISCKEDHHCATNQYCSKTGCKSSASRMFRRHCSSSSQCASSRCRSGYMGGPNDPSKRQKICVCNPGRGGCPDGAYRCGGNDETVCIGHRPID